MAKFKWKRIQTALRPHKIATFVFEGNNWRDRCLSTIETFSQIWGGAYNLIVPTNGEKIDEKFWFILERYDPDYIAVFVDDRDHFQHISDKLKKEIFDRCNTFLEYDGKEIDLLYLHKNSVNYPLTSFVNIFPNTNLESRVVYSYNIDYYVTNNTKKNFQLLYSSFLGNINEEYSNNLDSLGFNVHELKWKDLDRLSEGIFQNIDSYPYTNSPFSNSMLHLDKIKLKNDYPEKASAVIVIVGDDFEDFALYYNLSRLMYHVVWVPTEKIFNLEKFHTKDGEIIPNFFNMEFIMEILDKVDSLDRIFHSREKKIILTSFSLSEVELGLFKGKMIRTAEKFFPFDSAVFFQSDVTKNIDDILLYILRVYEHDNYSNSYREQFLDNNAVNPIQTPIPRNFNNRTFSDHNWITDVIIENYKLPLVHFLNDVISAPHYNDSEIRISKVGISYFCPDIIQFGDRHIEQYLIKPEINLIEPFEIFRRLFENIGFEIEYSDDGLFEMESTKKSGSLNRIAELFGNKSYITLFEQFIKETQPDNPENGVMIKDRICVSLDAMRNLLSEVEEPDIFLSELINKKIIERGFIFKCKRCLNADWYYINEITDQYTCKRCGKTQFYSKENSVRQIDDFEPQWYYKLDEVFYLGYKANIDVPILTLNKLKNESKDSFLYINQIKLRKPDSNRDLMEIDICCISDGEIFIGECKKPKKLPIKTIKKYANITSKLNASSVFSTCAPDGFSEDTKTTINKLCSGKNKIFNRNDLI